MNPVKIWRFVMSNFEIEYANKVIDGEWEADYIDSYDLNDLEEVKQAFKQTIALFSVAGRELDLDIVQDIMDFPGTNNLVK